MIRCRTCGTSYNETFTQCPLCGTRNPILIQKEKPSFVIDKVSLIGGELDLVKKIPANEVNTMVSFHIPFLLHLLDGNYEMKDNNHWIIIQLERVNEPLEHTRRYFGVGVELPQGGEIPNDRFGRLAHTHVSIFIPYKIIDDPNTFVFECPKCGIEVTPSATSCLLCGAKFGQEEIKKPAHSVIKRTTIAIFNKFLEAYRFYSREYHIEPIKNADIISFNCDYTWRGKTYKGYQYLVDTGSGGIRSGQEFILSDSVHNEIRDFLKSGRRIEIQELLLCNAKNHLVTEGYPLALIESVSALDIVLSDFIRKESDMPGINKDDVKKFIHDIGVSGQVKVVLKLLTKAENQLPDKIYSDCEGAITLRNNVIHQGLLNLNPSDIKRRIVAIEILIRYVQAILGKHFKT